MRTLQEFLDLICNVNTGVRYMEIPGRYGPAGPPSKRYLQRMVHGHPRTAQLPRIRDDDPLRDSVAITILESLGLEPTDYGY